MCVYIRICIDASQQEGCCPIKKVVIESTRNVSKKKTRCTSLYVCVYVCVCVCHLPVFKNL